MPRAGKRISPHSERVDAALNGEWRTAAQVAERADVAPRTARLHLAAMVKAGDAEERQTWPSLTYRRRTSKNGGRR